MSACGSWLTNWPAPAAIVVTKSIEWELSGLGYRKSHSFLDNETARDQLDRMCAGAGKDSYS
jgi:hypothetical protein